MEPKTTLYHDVTAVMRLPRPLVMTNGVFDILHRGHVEYLVAARELGAALVVAVNTDASARMLNKGPDRPLNRDVDRAAILSALRCVDGVLLFAERTPVDVLRQLRPDIYVKGGDYDMERLEETSLVRGWGGSAHAIAFRDGYSTTSIVNKIQAASSGAE